MADKQSSSFDSASIRRAFKGNLSDADLRLLRVFRTVVERGGFSAAEVTLNKSKSAISVDISQLEQRLGVTLCVRGRGGFALTEEGQIIYLAGLQLFHDLEKFRDRVETGLQRLTGEVSLLLLDNIVSIASEPISHALAAFGKRHPSVRIRLESADPVGVARGVLEEEAEIGISVVPRALATLSMIPLFREELKLYCGRAHPLFTVDTDKLNADEIKKYSLIEPGVFNDAGLAALIEACPIAGKANSVDSRILMVLSGLHLGFLPPQYAAPWLETDQLREIAVEGFSTTNTFYALIKKSSRQTAAAQRMLQTLLAEFRASPVGLPLDDIEKLLDP